MKIHFIGKENHAGIYSCSLIECVEYCKSKSILGLDIETTRAKPQGTYPNEHIYSPGLDPYLSKIVMLQIGDLENVYVIDTRTTDISELLPILNDPNITFVGANLKFEAKMLRHHYGVMLKTIWDVMLVDINLTNGLGWSKTNQTGLRYSLMALSERYLGIKNQEKVDLFSETTLDDITMDKSIRLGFLTIGDKPFTVEQIIYGAGDIEYPIRIKNIQQRGKGNYNPLKLHELENKFCLCLADIELKGMQFDKEQWLKVAKSKEPIYNHRMNKLNKYVEANYPKFCKPVDLFNSDRECDIMWSSSDQVIKFFRELGFCPKEKSKQTKKLEYTVGATALKKLLNSNYKEKYEKEIETDIVSTEDLILNYLLMKKSEQAITTFGEDWLKYIHPITGRVHSSYTQILNTGRISSNHPNLQNIPSDEEYRRAFVGQLVNADYASQESRILADVCGDKDMVSFFNDGHPIFGSDYHSFVATKMYRVIRKDPDLVVTKDTYPEERQNAKSINFKIAYGGSAYTLKDDFGVSEEVAQQFIDGYFEAIPSLKRDFEQAKEKVNELGYIEMDSVVNRRWHDPNFRKMYETKEKALSLYPEDYKFLSSDAKKAAKKKLYLEKPEIPELWSKFFSYKGKLERNSLNYRIQGVAGSQTKTAAILFRERQLKENLQDSIYITNLIHDEAIVEYVDPNDAEKAREMLTTCMIEGAQKFCSKVKMDAEGVITPFWYH